LLSLRPAPLPTRSHAFVRVAPALRCAIRQTLAAQTLAPGRAFAANASRCRSVNVGEMEL